MRHLWLGLPLALLVGCETQSIESPPTAPPLAIGARHDAKAAGIVSGRVQWVGEIPAVPDFEVRSLVTEWNPPKPRARRPNPHVPRIDPATKGVAGAVVFLRQVAPDVSRPWDHPPVVVEHIERALVINQGDTKAAVGFVRLGEPVTMLSREKEFNALRATGAAFFTLMFPDPDRELRRQLRTKGIVELSSGAGAYWMRAALFVCEHPYYVRTAIDGTFELSGVPPGTYELVCWMPNWNLASQDRDPESGLVTRVAFHPALETFHDVVVNAGRSNTHWIEVGIHQFKN